MKFRKKRTIKIIVLLILLVVLVAGFFEHKRRTDKSFVNISDIEHLIKHVYFAAQEVTLKPEPAKYLDIKFHRQEHSLSCEIAALKMVLDYRGLARSESELLNKLVFSDRGPRQAGNIWGNPEEGFVGDVNGKMPNSGYGVYEKPIYDIAIEYRRAENLKGATLAHLLNELEADNPSIVWGFTGSGRDISWKTKDGRNIKAVMGEHARVLIGYTGTKDNPQEIILMDPIYGKINLNIEKFLKEWKALDNRALIVF